MTSQDVNRHFYMLYRLKSIYNEPIKITSDAIILSFSWRKFPMESSYSLRTNFFFLWILRKTLALKCIFMCSKEKNPKRNKIWIFEIWLCFSHFQLLNNLETYKLHWPKRLIIVQEHISKLWFYLFTFLETCLTEF